MLQVLALTLLVGGYVPPYECRLYFDEQKKCAFGSCDRRALTRLEREVADLKRRANHRGQDGAVKESHDTVLASLWHLATLFPTPC